MEAQVPGKGTPANRKLWPVLIMFFVGYGCSFIAGDASFRTAWGIQFVPAVLLMLGIPFLPRSPRWLAKGGREAKAIEVLARIQAHGSKTTLLSSLNGRRLPQFWPRSVKLLIVVGADSSKTACGGGLLLVCLEA